jgi:hypothetical protein
LSRLLEPLSPDERIERYRQFAKDAFYQAHEASDGNLRAGFLTMAAAWHILAEETERALHGGAPQNNEAAQPLAWNTSRHH